MNNIEDELNQETELQTSGSEAVVRGSTNEVKTKPKRPILLLIGGFQNAIKKILFIVFVLHNL